MFVGQVRQQEVSQRWAPKERIVDGLDGIKNVALAAIGFGVTGGSAYLIYNFSSELGIKRSLGLTAIASGGLVAGSWKAMDAQRSFQSMWHGRAEMKRRDAAEWQRTKAAAANWIRSWF